MKTRQIRHFRAVLRRFTRLLDAQLKTCCSQVTLPQCLVLLEVEGLDRATVSRLARNLRLDNSTLSRTLDGLESRGLVERRRSDSDRRVVGIHLTADGEAACRAIHDENDAITRDVFARIPPARREEVMESFETLVRAYLDQETKASTGSSCSSCPPEDE